ncbi:Ras-related protein Rab-18 [Halotydeus destructor]|nr:Ras-related protein Rab-18 [Halotydeus destructor]
MTLQLTLKVVVIGESKVGKTSLLLRLTDDAFDEVVEQTVSLSFKQVDMILDDIDIRLIIWDTVGCDRHHAVSNYYYRNADAVLLVYDVNRRETLEDLDYWARDVDMYCKNNVMKILIGNKIELMKPNGQPTVKSKVSANWAADHEIENSLQTSAKNGYNVKNAFEAGIRRSAKFEEAKLKLNKPTVKTGRKKISLKVLFVGESHVGKTSLIRQATEIGFDSHVAPSSGIQLQKMVMMIDDIEVTLNLWDTAGNDRRKSALNNYYPNADVAVLVYSVISSDTLYALEYWAHDLELNCQNTRLVKLLLGNKQDLVYYGTKHVTLNDARKWAEIRQIANSFQTSAKADVSLILQHLSRLTAKFQYAKTT